jgi:AcrR family transcriptional regulator
MATRRLEKIALDPTTTADNREDQLIEIACRLFAQRGYDRTSLRDIADEAHLTKAALYYYFPQKEALYERIVLNSLRRLIDQVSAEVDRAETPVAKVRAFMLATADYLDQNRDAWIAGSNAFWTGEGKDRRMLAVDLRDEYEKLLRRCIAEAVRSGEFRDIDAAMADRFLLSTVHNIVRWHSPKGPLTIRQTVEQFLDFSLHGLVRRPT